ncbi:MAG TPA: RNA repair domain-containing protein, partial [Methanobacterium sp.]|nr:RNA repair domain-containing protein [Methanobacterium sp.]
PKKEIGRTKISYIHRGALGNIKSIQGDRIRNLEKGFLVLDDETHIPLHRIIKIEYDNEVVWNRTQNKKKEPK